MVQLLAQELAGLLTAVNMNCRIRIIAIQDRIYTDF